MVNYKSVFFIFLIFTFVGCAISLPDYSDKYVTDTVAFDESTINLDGDFNCDIEDFVREKFPSYRVHKHNETTIYFYDFKKLIETNRGRKFYLMELFEINYSNLSQIEISVKYFKSLNKRVNRIQKTNITGDGLSVLRNSLKNCNNGR